LGDRMSALVTATITGMASGRAVLLGHSRPAPLSSVFVPHMISWDASPCVPTSHGDYAVHPLYMAHPLPFGPSSWWAPTITSWSHISAEGWRKYPPEQMITLHGNGSAPVAYIMSSTWPDRLQHAPWAQNSFSPWLDAPHMLMEYDNIHLHRVFLSLLFKGLVPRVADRAESALASLLAPSSPNATDAPTSLLGLHIRVGDAAFLGKELDMVHIENVINRVLVKAAVVEDELGLDPKLTKWLVLTDTPKVKELVKARLGDKCVFSPVIPGHIDKGTPDERALAFESVFVDVALLGSTRCIVGPLSGFSRIAASLSPRPERPCIRVLPRDYMVGNG